MDINIQKEILNKRLYTIFQRNCQNNNNNNDNNSSDVTMNNTYDKNKDYFFFQIKLLELIPKEDEIKNRNIFSINESPQKVFLEILRDDKTFKKRKINNFYHLCYMITPNLNKSIWYFENDLKQSKIITTYCKMNIKDMRDMLKNCPDPNICLLPSAYNISTPESFIQKIRTEFKEDTLKTFNFIPFIRINSLNSIKENNVYYLYDKHIHLMEKHCYQYM